jgi:hypothetical protein
MNERTTEVYAYMHAMMGALSAMSSNERKQLERWEKENLDGHSIATSDWPGWEKHIGLRPTFEDRAFDHSGFIYLIRNGQTSHYKIGISKNVISRINTLQTGNPEKLSLISFFPTTDTYKQEQKLHNHYSQKRVTGEWFVLDEYDINYFLSIAKSRTDSI